MKTFIKFAAIVVAAEGTLLGVAYLIITYTTCAKEIGIGMGYAFALLTAVGTWCIVVDSDSKLGNFLFSLLFVGFCFAVLALTISVML